MIQKTLELQTNLNKLDIILALIKLLFSVID